MQSLHRALETAPPDQPLAELLCAHPDLRMIARRVQGTGDLSYAEVQDNLLAADVLPIDLMRCKLAFFGASQFDPKSDKWVRIALFRGAPFPIEGPPEPASGVPAAAPQGACTSQLSRAEVEALTLKAARGAGYDWGLAEEAAMAMGRLWGWGLAAAPALAVLLRTVRNHGSSAAPAPCPARGRWSAPTHAPLCPLLTGAALTDFADLPQGLRAAGTLCLPAVHWPVLLLPFAATLAAAAGQDVVLTIGADEVRVTSLGTPKGALRALLTCPEADVTLRLAPYNGQIARRPDPSAPRPAIAAETLAELEILALETAVPPSAVSRKDAGAEGSDND